MERRFKFIFYEGLSKEPKIFELENWGFCKLMIVSWTFEELLFKEELPFSLWLHRVELGLINKNHEASLG